MKVLSTTSLKKLLNLIKTNFYSKTESTTVNTLSIDSAPTTGSTNLVTSGGVKTAIDNVQPDLSEYRTSAEQDIIDNGKENVSNKVTSISASSTDSQYPTAKAVYNAIMSQMDIKNWNDM